MSLVQKGRRALDFAAAQIRSTVAEPAVRKSLAAKAPQVAAAECLVYFADEPMNSYQVRQWYEPMRRLAERHPVAIVARSPLTAGELAADSPLPVALATSMSELDRILTGGPAKLMFYVNNNKENFLPLRFPHLLHVHLSHGESDKASMVSNQLKAYDYAFIAGTASRERILRELRHFDASHLVAIGRPQLDGFHPGRELPDDGRTVVLYAPTWEGDRPAMAYGSIASHGETLMSALLADPRIRVIYRPHPRAGVRDQRQGTASRAIQAAIGAANLQDPDARHIIDDAPSFGWVLDAADICICDISAVAADWLATRKPLIVTRPTDPMAKVDPAGLAGSLDLLPASEASSVPAMVHSLRREGTKAAQLDLVQHHFGDTSPGTSMDAFLAAAEKLLSEPAC